VSAYKNKQPLRMAGKVLRMLKAHASQEMEGAYNEVESEQQC